MTVIRFSKQDYLMAFLNLYWLRPETALWRTLDCLALKDVEFHPPIIDIGCGDGVFSFTRAGGLFDPSYDVFIHTGKLDSFFLNVDIYDSFENKNSSPRVIREPAYTIDVGLDNKEALLKKALSTRLYKEVKLADANKILPVENSSFRTIFSNILYWIEKYPLTLREMNRIVADDGIVVLHVPNETFHEYSFYYRLHVKTSNHAWKWLHPIDRGRSQNIKFCRSFEEWRDDFVAAGFKVIHHRQYLSKTVLEAWDIGLRPISPYLIEMTNKLNPNDRADIKHKWIQGIVPLIEPLCELEWITDYDYPPGFHLFVLEKENAL